MILYGTRHLSLLGAPDFLQYEMTTTIVDYNGTGRWTSEAVVARYAEYCKRFRISKLEIAPRVHSDGKHTWIYPVMEQIVLGIAKGDAACRLIGLEFIEEDQKFTFGKTLKANTARVLRQNHELLCEADRERICRRVLSLLERGLVPHEFREYAKLARKVGMKECREPLAKIDRSNPYVAKYCKYLEEA